MKKHYDFSQYPAFIVFDFNSKEFTSSIIFSYSSNHRYKSLHSTTPSVLYNIITGAIIERGKSADELWQSEKYPHDHIYVRNIFMALDNIFLEKEHNSDENNVHHEIVTQEVIMVLQDHQKFYKDSLTAIAVTPFGYVFNLPTYWDNTIRDELLRPLFIEAGLINKNGHGDRLIFLTRLEVASEYIYDTDCSKTFKIGQQHVLLSFEVDEKIHFNLDSFSIQYPSPALADSKYSVKSLESHYFTIPYKPIQLKQQIKKLLENHCKTVFSPSLIDMLAFETFASRDLEEEERRHDPNNSTRDYPSTFLSFYDYFNCQPFKGLRDLYDKKYELGSEDIEFIQLININDILFEDLTESIGITFTEKMDFFFGERYKKSISSMIIVCEDDLKVPDNLALLNYIKAWSDVHREQKGFYKSVPYRVGKINSKGFSLDLHNRTRGSYHIMNKSIKRFNRSADPNIVLALERGNWFGSTHGVLYYINIEILALAVRVKLTYLGKDSQVKKPAIAVNCDIKPLDSFITESELYLSQALLVSDRTKEFMENTFGQFIKRYSDMEAKAIVWDFLANYGLKTLETILEKVQLKEIFSKKNHVVEVDNNNVKIIRQPDYIFYFKVMYLYYLRELIEESLDKNFGDDWRDKHIAFAVSIDKKLLDYVFGSKKELDQLFYVTGILQKDNKNLKARILFHGEEILPAIQLKLTDLNFKMKSYFVVTQIFPNHIQLTLHQVVRLKSPENDGATIIVQDSILPISKVHEALCNKLWNNILSGGHINLCKTHKKKIEETGFYDEFCSVQNYNDICKTLELTVLEVLHKNKANLDMDAKIETLKLNSCTCNFSLSLRAIIELGFNPVIRDIAKTIAASLTNKEIFGNYEVDFVFLLGDPFNIYCNRPLYDAYIVMTQHLIDIAIEVKEKDTRGFVLSDSLDKLLEPLILNKPFMYANFVKGSLHQVLHSTFQLRFLYKKREAEYTVPWIVFDDDGSDFLVEKEVFFTTFQMGQILPITGLKKKINLCFKVQAGIEVYAVVLQLEKLRDTMENNLNFTKNDTKEAVFLLNEKYHDGTLSNDVVLELKYNSYNYPLEFTMKTHNLDSCRIKRHCVEYPLSVAYI